MQSGILHRSHSTPFHSFLQNHPRPSTFYLRFPSLSYSLPALCAKFPRGTPDSAAEGLRSWSFGRKQDGGRRWKAKKQSRRWWSDDGNTEAEELAPGIREEFIDNIWLLKVFGYYGWVSPFIVISWLAASGPKAFLMAFSIPLGLNLLTFAFIKLWGWVQSNTNYKPTSKPYSENVNVMMEEEEEEEEEEIQWKRTQDQSDSGEYRENGSVNSDGSPSFGGWEDLIDERQLKARRARRPRRTANTTSVTLEERMSELKTRVEGEKELPLLLKLLVAIFPFLSSWTELL